MDDIIIYLIFLGFALLSRLLTKKKDPAAPPKRPRTQEEREEEYGGGQRPKSFEELLREFSEEREPEPTVRERKPEPVSEYTSYEDEPYQTAESYEEEYLRDEEAKEVYEKSVNQAKNLKTIDELVDYDTVKTKLDSGKFDPYSKKDRSTLADQIRNDLQKPDEVRKAVIYAEILQRKY